MSCFGFRDRLDDYLDGELPPWVEAEFEAHVAGCAECRARVAHERTVRDGLRRALRDVEVPSWLAARVSAAIAFTSSYGPPDD
ncbi:MAG TPA: anti-sigma factor [Gemmatimonadales bacterium]|nr:anti-sigma factor [Gemmatimonadales bacterium]